MYHIYIHTYFSPSTVGQPFCDVPPDGSIYLNGKYYYAATETAAEKVAFEDANTFCTTLGMKLATVNTVEDAQAVEMVMDTGK